ncbi:MAG: alkaline phosphatase family protein [Candidatus Latescibacterota bacterium]
MMLIRMPLPRNRAAKFCAGLCLLLPLMGWVLVACGDSATGTDDSADGEVSYNAVLVVIDGARYTETFGDSTHRYIPHMWDDLKPQGLVFDHFRNEGETKTNPGMTSLATGTWQHVANDGSERPTMPTFFEYFRKALAAPESLLLVVAGKSKLNICSYSTHVEYGAPFGAREHVDFPSDVATYEGLKSDLTTGHPRLVVVNLSEVDWDGHTGIWSEYTDAIQTADSLVWELWRFLQSDPFYAGKTYLFITNDHGRHDDAHGGFKNHGDDCEGCRHIMLLAMGPGMRRNWVMTTPYSQIDICPTFGSLVGFDTPYCEGQVISGMLMARKSSSEADIHQEQPQPEGAKPFSP